MSFIWALIVSAFVLVFIGVSAAANWMFGLTLDTFDPVSILGFKTTRAEVWGVVSIAVDAMACLLPFGIVAGWRHNHEESRAASVVLASMWIFCLCWSWQSAVGFVVSSNQKIIDTSMKTARSVGDINEEIERAKDQRRLVPVHRELAIVQKDIANLKAANEWRWSDGCTDVKLNGQFCGRYRGLLAEETSANEANRLDGKLSALRNERDIKPYVTVADPLATALASLIGTSSGEVTKGRAWLFATFVLLVASLGPWAVWESRGNDRVIGKLPALRRRPRITLFKHEIQEVIKADPVPQLVEPETVEEEQEIPLEDNQEAPLKDTPSKPLEDDQEDSLEDVQKDAPEKPKKPTPKQIKKAAKDNPDTVVLGPFGLASGSKAQRPATSDLKSVVASFVRSLEPGEYPIDALHKRIAPTAKRSGLNPAKRHVGEALRKLDFEPKKRGGKIVYVITGGASQDAMSA